MSTKLNTNLNDVVHAHDQQGSSKNRRDTDDKI
jgi:hypothetical protein